MTLGLLVQETDARSCEPDASWPKRTLSTAGGRFCLVDRPCRVRENGRQSGGTFSPVSALKLGHALGKAPPASDRDRDPLSLRLRLCAVRPHDGGTAGERVSALAGARSSRAVPLGQAPLAPAASRRGKAAGCPFNCWFPSGFLIVAGISGRQGSLPPGAKQIGGRRPAGPPCCICSSAGSQGGPGAPRGSLSRRYSFAPSGTSSLDCRSLCPLGLCLARRKETGGRLWDDSRSRLSPFPKGCFFFFPIHHALFCADHRGEPRTAARPLLGARPVRRRNRPGLPG